MKFQYGTQEELDAAKDDSSKLPFDKIFKFKHNPEYDTGIDVTFDGFYVIRDSLTPEQIANYVRAYFRRTLEQRAPSISFWVNTKDLVVISEEERV